MFESIKELGLTGWPAVAGIAIICFSIVAFWTGRWPWTGIVTKNYYGKRRRNEEDED
jgi:hypothetical protein